MPELVPHSTPTPHPLPPPLYVTPPDDPPATSEPFVAVQVAAVPPAADPDAWEELPCFRETFLMYVTPKGYDAALRTFGEMLYALMLEAPAEWPGWTESATKTEMRAAAADLRHLQGFLASVGRERKASSLDPEDAYLSNVAARLSRQIGHAADGIERELAGVKP